MPDQSQSHTIRDQFIAGILVLVVWTIFQIVWGQISSILKSFSDFLNYLTSPLPLPRWAIGLIGFYLSYRIVHSASQAISKKRADAKESAYLNYVKGVYRNTLWRWTYTTNGNVTGLQCFCLECDLEMNSKPIKDSFTDDLYTSFYCHDHPDQKFELKGDKDSVELQMIQEVERDIRDKYKKPIPSG